MKDYQDKVISVDEALEMVGSTCEIVTGLGGSEGKALLSNLHKIYDRIERVEVTNCLPMSNFEFFKKEYSDRFFLNGWFYSPGMRAMHKNGNASFIPNNLHFAGYKRFFHKKPDIYVGSATMPDKHGYISLSLGNTYEREAMDLADIVILECNPNFPRTFGDISIHVRDVDYIIEAEYKPPILTSPKPNEKDEKIGKFIADQIGDGSCIQLGIGGIPDSVAKFLYDKKDLGVHTEMLTSEIAKLAKAGVITGNKLTLHKGKIMTTFILGDQDLYDFVDDNPSVEVRAGNYTNDPYIIGQIDNMVSINTTLEIDLTGQCASESIGSKQFSGSGGQADTAIGAQNAKGGKSFIALYSTAMVRNPETGEKEEKSKILPQLTPGAAVSLSRNDVDFVVTEYGIAALRGTTIQERVERLIAIAHPKYREWLYEEAMRLEIITRR